MYKKIETEGWKVSNAFKVITSVSVYDVNDDEEKLQALVDEQDKILESRGFGRCNGYCELLRSSEGYGFNDIDEAIQCLALKDGVDLVEFESGNLGYVGYYHGFNENWFEIIPTTRISEHCNKIDDRTIAVYDDGLTWVYEVAETDLDKAVKLIEFATDAWWDNEKYPEYEYMCCGDVMTEQFEKNGIKYTEKGAK